MREISKYDDVIDSRDVIERIEELEFHEYLGSDDTTGESLLTDEERHELAALRALAEDGETISDWIYGATLVRDSYCETYAQEFAEDIGAVPQDFTWPTSYIDWERVAADLRMDYYPVEFDGITYWAR